MWPNTGITVAVRFTSKERDSETGLDNFLARYLSSAQGRFISPDAALIDQRTSDPQSWSLYTYVRNNPLQFTDPTGTTCVNKSNSNGSTTTTDDGSGCVELQKSTSVNVHDFEPPSPLLLAVAQGTQRAGPTVNLLGSILGLAARIHPVLGAGLQLADCAGLTAPDCDPSSTILMVGEPNVNLIDKDRMM